MGLSIQGFHLRACLNAEAYMKGCNAWDRGLRTCVELGLKD